MAVGVQGQRQADLQEFPVSRSIAQSQADRNDASAKTVSPDFAPPPAGQLGGRAPLAVMMPLPA